MSPDEETVSNFGNSSLSSFLSTLFDDEEATSVNIVSDNAKPELRSLLSLRLVDDEPKCRWNNLVRMDSDPDLMVRNRRNGRKSVSISGGVTCQPGRRCGSDPNLIQMPMRTTSPKGIQSKPSISINSKRTMSDPYLLQMPKRLPSPHQARSESSKVNASWGKMSPGAKIRQTNMFLDMMMGSIGDEDSSSIRDKEPLGLSSTDHLMSTTRFIEQTSYDPSSSSTFKSNEVDKSKKSFATGLGRRSIVKSKASLWRELNN